MARTVQVATPSRTRGHEPAAGRARPSDGDRFDRGYWLAHCEGFLVDGVEGRLGFVEDVSDGVLLVRAGRLGRRLLLVAEDDVEFIVPRAERIWLRAPTVIAGSRPVQ